MNKDLIESGNYCSVINDNGDLSIYSKDNDLSNFHDILEKENEIEELSHKILNKKNKISSYKKYSKYKKILTLIYLIADIALLCSLNEVSIMHYINEIIIIFIGEYSLVSFAFGSKIKEYILKKSLNKYEEKLIEKQSKLKEMKEKANYKVLTRIFDKERNNKVTFIETCETVKNVNNWISNNDNDIKVKKLVKKR